MKMKFDILNKKYVDHYLLNDCFLYNGLFELQTTYYSNTRGMAGYILKNVNTNSLYFVENTSLDSWEDGCGFSDDVEEIEIYEVLSHEPKYDYYEIGEVVNTIEVDYDEGHDDGDDDSI